MQKKQRILRSYVICLFALLILLHFTNAFAATINVPGDYSTIQAAINAAESGDTVLVADGTYYENVNVDKQIIIKSLDGYNVTTVIGQRYDHVFDVKADKVTIEGFTIYVEGNPSDMQAGIFLESGISYCTIINNRCGYDINHKNGIGIKLDDYSNNNTISDNICNSNYRIGIQLINSSYNYILNNSCNFSSRTYGIKLDYSDNNIVSQNSCNSNPYAGIISFYSNNNTFSKNNCSGNYSGITIADQCTQNIIIENICSNNSEGMEVRYSANNNIFLNNIFNSNVRIGLIFYQHCINNTISRNLFSENKTGVSLFNSNNNIFYLNEFINNALKNISSNGSNNWHSPTITNYIYGDSLHRSYLGNFYSNHNLTDSNGDGITDDSYVLENNEPNDDYPLITSSDNYSIVILPSLVGDFDHDGDVDGDDLKVFAESIGKTM